MGAYERQTLHGSTIVFAGRCGANATYCYQVINACRDITGLATHYLGDGVKCEMLGEVSKRDLAKLYKGTIGTVLYSQNDCNPRATYESLIMNKPFFSTFQAQVPNNLHHLGHVIEFGQEDTAEEFALFVNALEKNMFADRPKKFADEYLLDAAAYGKVIDWIDKQYY